MDGRAPLGCFPLSTHLELFSCVPRSCASTRAQAGGKSSFSPQNMDDLSTLIFDTSFKLSWFSGQMQFFSPLNQGNSYSPFCFLSSFSVSISDSCPYPAGTEQKFGPAAAEVVPVPGSCCLGPSLG